MSRLTAWSHWQDAAGPWRGWVVCPVLTMPSDLPNGAAADWTSDDDLSEVLVGEGTAVLLDLEAARGVRMAANVSQRGLAHVVLLLPRWPHVNAVLPGADLLATLLASSPRVGSSASSNVVFVLDAQRQQAISRDEGDPRVDNRYALSPTELPSLATLRAAGIRRVVKVTARS